MRFVSDRASAMIDRVLAAKTEDFLQLTLAAGLSPVSDFRNVLLRGVNFAKCDLEAFDFSGTIFESCRFEDARIVGARFDGSIFEGCNLEDAADYGVWVSAQMASRGTVRGGHAMERDGPAVGSGPNSAGNSKPKASPRGPEQHAEVWRVRGLCELTNFNALRRKLGTDAVTRLMLDISRALEQATPTPYRVAVSQATIDLAFGSARPASALADLERLHAGLPRAHSINDELHKLRWRFGAASLPSEMEPGDRLIEAAERALAQAPADGPMVLIDLSRETLFDPLDLLADLPRAMAKNEFYLLYQPKVHVGRHQVAGAEALLRWMHPERGAISPAEFIPAAEDGGEIGDLTLWVLRHAIEDQERLQDDGHDIPLFINISGVLLTDAEFIDKACALVDARSARIGFEITETSVIRDPERALHHLRLIADHGIAIAIDDYGAGLSSLAYLKKLPASELKIDRMFVGQLTSSNRDPLIIRSTIDLAHALEMEVTAEGVETASALALLSVMGCDMVQGFLISRPLDIKALRAFLAEEQHIPAQREQPSIGGRESFWKRS